MAALRDVILYICKRYPHKGELSKARLTKMVYLADWRAAILHRKQITNIVWEFSHYGPYVEDVIRLARKDPAFIVLQDVTLYGGPKELIHVRDDARWNPMSPMTQDILEFVIESCAPKTWHEFIKLVYSTYPIVTQPRYTKLNLIQLAEEYAETIKLLAPK